MVKIVVDGDERVLVDPAIVLKGEDGKDGLNGRDGVDGKEGPQGLPGKDGRDGVDGKDGKNGVSYWIEYDKKKEELIFKNDGGKKNPAPIKLAISKGWGFGAGRAGGGQIQADWNQTNKNDPTYIKNKPEIHNVEFRVVDELPEEGDSWSIYLVPLEDPETPNIYEEYIWCIVDTDTYGWEKIGTTDIDLSGYITDVQINSTSVVSGGVANIPIVANNVAGVVVGDGGIRGINFFSSGNPYIVRAIDTEVTAKTSGFKPLTPINIDLAVKTGLTTNTLSFDSTEKGAACDLIGAVKDVQVNSTSLVTSGVATIPLAELNGTYGLVKLYNYDAGITKTNNGIAVLGAADFQITGKSSTSRPILPGKIDLAASVSARSVYDKTKAITSGSIALDDGTIFYTDSPSAATTYTIDSTALTQTGFTYRYINVLINMPSSAVGLDFTTNNNVVWTENETPDMSVGGRTYLLAFQTFNSGTTWIGSLCTWWETPSA